MIRPEPSELNIRLGSNLLCLHNKNHKKEHIFNTGSVLAVTGQTDKIEALQILCGGILRTRFAPSPTGYLHLGHAYSALCAWQAVGERAEYFHLRIDDLDETRCKDSFTRQIFSDLRWLGIAWQEPVIYQSKRHALYAKKLAILEKQGLVYPCYLSRKEAGSLLSAPHLSADGLVPAPSTRHLLDSDESRQRAASGMPPVWRLDSQRALASLSGDTPLFWRDHTGTKHSVNPAEFGDVVLGRRDSPASYHLSTVIDDADSAITLVVRGADLAPVTQIHRLLQAVLGLPSPVYWHHPLVTDEAGQRLAKRHVALALKTLRETQKQPADILKSLPEIGLAI